MIGAASPAISSASRDALTAYQPMRTSSRRLMIWPEVCRHGIIMLETWPVLFALVMIYYLDAALHVPTNCNLPKSATFSQSGASNHRRTEYDFDERRRVEDVAFDTILAGFIAGNMVNRVSPVVNSVQVFCGILRENVGAGLV
ncbi:hypothetical protein BDW66DRAFT_64448 [Aspergillus desertorum]